MKPLASRSLATAVLVALACLLVAAAAPKQTASLQPDKLIIISTTDVKGKTSPCG